MRSLEDLSTALDGEMSWRKKELLWARTLVNSTTGESRQSALRSCICLAYAHWEGFVRESTRLFFEYVSEWLYRSRSDFFSTSAPVAAMRVWIEVGQRSVAFPELLQAYVRASKDPYTKRPNLKALVETESNLTFAIFRKMLVLIRANETTYVADKALIDERLLRLRNEVAHGENPRLDLSEVLDCVERVMNLLETYRNDLDNCAIEKRFVRR